MNKVAGKPANPKQGPVAFVNFDAAAWANRPLSNQIFDTLSHFLLSHPSANTRAAYARDLSEFLTFSREINCKVETVEHIDETLILLWKEALVQKHARFNDSKRRVANASVARKLCTLSSLLDFALKRGLLSENPMKLIKRPTVRRQSHATVLNESELMSILASSRNHLSTLRSMMSEPTEKAKAKLKKAEDEYCILVLLFTVGMRVSELCQLKLSDLIWDGDLLRINLLAKGSRRHRPLVHPETTQILLNYISKVRAGASLSEPVFPTARTSSGDLLPRHRSSVFRIVRDAARRAGIQRNFSPHGCRATLATQLHLNEVPLVEIQTLLNHAQVTTTQLYLHRVDELKEAAALQLPWAEGKPLRANK